MSSLKFLSAVETRPRVVNEAIRKLQEVTARDTVINVKDYGAKGDGSTDDTTAIVNAIAAVPAAGGVVYFPVGVYMVDSDSLSIGDGDNTNISTIQGIALIGEAYSPYVPTKGVTIKARSSGTNLLLIKGFINGVRIENILFDCDEICTVGLKIFSCSNSSFKNFGVIDFTAYGVFGDCRSYAADKVGWSARNIFQDFHIVSTVVGGFGAGISLQGNNSGFQPFDWHGNTFNVGIIQINKHATNATRCLDLRFTDSNTFIEVDCSMTGSGSGYGAVFDGSQVAGYPQNLHFFGCSILSTFVSGTIGPNWFLGFSQYDGETVPTDTLLYGYDDAASFFGAWKFRDALTLTAGQLVFPATQNASSNANTLDDYEEGQTTPTPTPDGGSFTTVSCTINYTKIGRAVSINGKVTITDAGTATGGITVALPFTAGSFASFSGREISATGFSVNADVPASGTTTKLWKYDFTTIIASGREVVFSGTYFV